MINDVTKATSWLPYRKPSHPVRLRLFCFPYAGGGASIFRLWNEMLPDDIEVCAVQLPGRENRLLEPPIMTLPALLGPLAEALVPFLSVPYAFFGYSMGALIGFELTHYLKRSGLVQSPAHLFVAAHRAPQLPDPQPPIHQMPTPTFAEKLLELGGTPEDVLRNMDLLNIVLPFLRSDFALCETYHYRHYEKLQCPVSVFSGIDDPFLTYADLEAWNKQTINKFKVRLYPGNHFFIHTQREGIIDAIRHDLGVDSNP